MVGARVGEDRGGREGRVETIAVSCVAVERKEGSESAGRACIQKVGQNTSMKC